jgi:hypothetical protein
MGKRFNPAKMAQHDLACAQAMLDGQLPGCAALPPYGQHPELLRDWLSRQTQWIALHEPTMEPPSMLALLETAYPNLDEFSYSGWTFIVCETAVAMRASGDLFCGTVFNEHGQMIVVPLTSGQEWLPV